MSNNDKKREFMYIYYFYLILYINDLNHRVRMKLQF
jgi:hypothetical protein